MYYKIMVNRGDFRGWVFWDSEQDIDHGEYNFDQAVKRLNYLREKNLKFQFQLMQMTEIDA